MRLSLRQQEQCRKLYARGMHLRVIAQKMGCSRSTIQKTVRGVAKGSLGLRNGTCVPTEEEIAIRALQVKSEGLRELRNSVKGRPPRKVAR
jgi:transcriptional regulator with XRE-family HTH domain